MKKTFEVVGEVDVEVYTLVEAETAEEAIELAKARSVGMFTTSALDKWVLDDLDGVPVMVLGAEESK